MNAVKLNRILVEISFILALPPIFVAGFVAVVNPGTIPFLLNEILSILYPAIIFLAALIFYKYSKVRNWPSKTIVTALLLALLLQLVYDVALLIGLSTPI